MLQLLPYTETFPVPCGCIIHASSRASVRWETYKHIMKNVLKIHCLVRVQMFLHLSLHPLQNSVSKYEQSLY